MAKSWKEIKALLDDPSVSPMQKSILLSSYQNENQTAFGMVDPSKVPPDEWKKYTDAYAPMPWLGGQSTDEAYKNAKDEADQANYNDREKQKDIDAGKQKLQSAQPPDENGGGTKMSDELLDAAAPSLKVFEDFLPLLAKIPDDCRGRTKALDFGNDIKKRFDEQRGINFAEFMNDAKDFKAGGDRIKTALGDTSTQLNTLFQSWTGKAADAARDHYNEKIADPANTVMDNLNGAAKATGIAVDAVYRLVKGKCDAVVQKNTNLVGKADKPMAELVINIANGSHAGKDELGKVAGWMDVNFGTNLVETLNDDGCCDDDEIIEHGKDLAKQWIQKHFNPDIWDNHYLSFDKTCKDTLDLVNKAYDELDKVMGDFENEFANAEAENQPPPPKRDDSGGGTGTGNGGGGTGTGSGGGGTGSGGGGGSTTPEGTQPPTAGDKPEDKPADGMNPVTGKPLEKNPETGEPYPIDPTTGEAIKDAGDDQDKMTVQKGDNKISMTEPDKDGKMGISVDDGKGNLKDYKLDFGTGEEGKPGADGQPQDPNAQGADKVYKPGPDGKIHIEDGNLKITAEQPQGPDGPTVVTVDDGTGEPTKYTLDEEGKDGAAGADGAKDGAGKDGVTDMVGKPGEANTQNPLGGDTGAQSGKLDGVTTMPAPAGGGGFDAPGGVDLGGAPGADAPAAAAGGDGAAVGGDAGGVPGQGTDPAVAGAGGGSPFDSAGGGAQGAFGGSLGDTDSLDAGAQTGSAMPAHAAAPAPAGLGAAPGGGIDPSAAAGQQGATAGGMGGMPMMGGMGGAGGGGGGDQERGSNPYRVDGAIFETSGAGGRISGSLDEEGDRSIRYDR